MFFSKIKEIYDKYFYFFKQTNRDRLENMKIKNPFVSHCRFTAV